MVSGAIKGSGAGKELADKSGRTRTKKKTKAQKTMIKQRQRHTKNNDKENINTNKNKKTRVTGGVRGKGRNKVRAESWGKDPLHCASHISAEAS